VGIGDNGKGDKTEAERDVDRALHIGLGRVGFHFKGIERCEDVKIQREGEYRHSGRGGVPMILSAE
jgi:hypothetical protein